MHRDGRSGAERFHLSPIVRGVQGLALAEWFFCKRRRAGEPAWKVDVRVKKRRVFKYQSNHGSGRRGKPEWRLAHKNVNGKYEAIWRWSWRFRSARMKMMPGWMESVYNEESWWWTRTTRKARDGSTCSSTEESIHNPWRRGGVRIHSEIFRVLGGWGAPWRRKQHKDVCRYIWTGRLKLERNEQRQTWRSTWKKMHQQQRRARTVAAARQRRRAPTPSSAAMILQQWKQSWEKESGTSRVDTRMGREKVDEDGESKAEDNRRRGRKLVWGKLWSTWKRGRAWYFLSSSSPLSF